MSIDKLANSPQAEFEQSFFQLAFDQLQEKLYKLQDHLVGFEIVNKSSDNTKAVGVFGFKADNGQMLFVPAFFINGEVRGVDIMYSKNNEQFYPLNEDFAELFLKDDASGLGSTSDVSAEKLRQQMGSVDIQSLVRPPRTGKVSYASVIDFVKESDNTVKKAFSDLIEKDAEFTESLLRFYTIEKIGEAIVPKVAKEKTLPVSSISVYTKEDDLSALSEKDKQRVWTEGFVVVDKRKKEEVSKFGLTKYENTFTNPTEPGFYSYLTHTGSLRYALVLTQPMAFNRFYPTTDSIVLDLSTNMGLGYKVENKKLFTKGKYLVQDLSTLFKKFEEPAEVKPSFEDNYVLVNEELKSSVPFRVCMNYKDDAGLRRIQIETISVDDCDCTASYGPKRKWDNRYYKTDEVVDRGWRKYTLVLTKRGGNKFEYSDDVIYIPKGFKLLPISFKSVSDNPSSLCSKEDEKEWKKREEENRKKRERYEQGRPGSIHSMLTALKAESVFPMSVTTNGSQFFVTINDIKKKYESPLMAKIALMKTAGLDQASAFSLIDEVEKVGSRKGYIKLAYTGDEVFSYREPTPYTNELGQTTYDGVGYSEVQNPSHVYTQDPTRIGLGTMPEIEGVQGAVDQANQLAQAGQKEIFDTHSIATLAKYVTPQSKVTSYMPDFISCLDKLGRMLFLIHWQTEKFEEMYGRSELPELTELLSNVFKNLGDLVIFLKRKSPELSINSSEQSIEA